MIVLVGSRERHSQITRSQTGRKTMHIIRFLKEETGATAIEYGLIASLISVAIVAVLLSLGGKLTDVFTKVETSLKTE